MKKLIFSCLCMVLFMLPAGILMAQGIVGESDPFTFDTRPVLVPLSNIALLFAGFLVAAFLFLRYNSQRKRAQV